MLFLMKLFIPLPISIPISRLRSEISLLPDHFLPSYYGHGDATNYDSSCANPTNVLVEEDLSLGNSSGAANLVQNGGNTHFPTSASRSE
jgi:hypothetical protein